MTERQKQIFKCPVCDTVVELLESCGLELVCCGPAMVQLWEKTCSPEDPHALIITKSGNSVKVRVGSRPHEMQADHRIVWIEARSGDKCYRQFLHVGQAPEAVFNIEGAGITVRAYCNAHGLFINRWDKAGLKARHQHASTGDMVAV
jgi:superoxide reductase